MKLRLLLSSLIWCVASLPSHACYLISTQASGEFQAPGYWKEAGEIKFLMPNGVIGVAESEILTIRRMHPGFASQCDSTTGAMQAHEETDVSVAPEAVPPPAPLMISEASSGAPLKSGAYQKFEKSVMSLEVELRRLGTMSSEELQELPVVRPEPARHAPPRFRSVEVSLTAAISPLLHAVRHASAASDDESRT
jgi:hypothetical protein